MNCHATFIIFGNSFVDGYEAMENKSDGTVNHPHPPPHCCVYFTSGPASSTPAHNTGMPLPSLYGQRVCRKLSIQLTSLSSYPNWLWQNRAMKRKLPKQIVSVLCHSCCWQKGSKKRKKPTLVWLVKEEKIRFKEAGLAISKWHLAGTAASSRSPPLPAATSLRSYQQPWNWWMGNNQELTCLLCFGGANRASGHESAESSSVLWWYSLWSSWAFCHKVPEQTPTMLIS